MSVLKLAGFAGEAPRITPRLLPATGAQISLDVRLEDGQLAPFRKPFPVAALPGVSGTVKTIYRHQGEWLWWSTAVHAVPGPVAQDRLYFTGNGVPKMRVAGTTYPLKVPAPTTALTAAVTSGTVGAVYSTRLYVYTFVTDFGEETEPNAASNPLNVSPGNVVTLSGFAAPPPGRAITKQRIYRSQTGTAGGTNFYFIAERTTSSANFVDNIATDDYNEPLPSLEWSGPPDGLSGLVSLPNGMMAAYSGKDIWFCEPFRPHVWPEKYVLTTDYEITGLGAYGTTLVVGTKGNPYLVGGTSPETMSMEKMELNMPCLNVQGVVDLGYALVYPTHDGLAKVEGGAASLPTQALLTRDQWQKYKPENMVCGQFYGRFFGSYSYIDTAGALNEGTLIVDLSGDSPFLIRSKHRADAFFYDVQSGSLFMAVGDTVYEWDSKLSINDMFTWRSKEFILPAPTSFGAMMFELDQRTTAEGLEAFEDALESVIAQNTALFGGASLEGALNAAPINAFAVNGDVLLPLPAGPQMTVNVYADGELVVSCARAGVMQRLPAKRLARRWEIEFAGNTNVVEFAMASTGQELRSV